MNKILASWGSELNILGITNLDLAIEISNLPFDEFDTLPDNVLIPLNKIYIFLDTIYSCSPELQKYLLEKTELTLDELDFGACCSTFDNCDCCGLKVMNSVNNTNFQLIAKLIVASLNHS